MRRNKVRGPQSKKPRYRVAYICEPGALDANPDRSTKQSLRWHPRGNSSLKQFFQRGANLLFCLLLNGLNEIIVELLSDRIEPLPIAGERLENDSASVAPNADFFAIESKIFGKSNRLRPARPKYFGFFHNAVYQKYISAVPCCLMPRLILRWRLSWLVI